MHNNTIICEVVIPSNIELTEMPNDIQEGYNHAT